ncbi:MAG: DUF6106 family protein [Lachnospiraceae bacterium]|jgi:hypothetical protein
MNQDIYAEWLVKRKTPAWVPLAWVLFIFALFASLIFTMTNQFGFIAFVLVIIAFYFIRMRFKVEYEYIFVTNELSIDRILSQSSRKRMTTISMSDVEKVVPFGSHDLDFIKNNPTVKPVDYTSADKKNDMNKYAIIYSKGGQQVVYFEPNEHILKCMKQAAPHKVFLRETAESNRISG